MSVNYNSNIVRDGLILHLDAANRKSHIGAASLPLISSKLWRVGAGATSGFAQNGSDDENQRIVATDPWGNQNVIWETRANGTAAADGGWNADPVPIDKSKLYRFSVWVKRTSSTSSGTFYFGTGASGQEVVRTDNNLEQGNPYWECANTDKLDQNVWFLVCGHIYPADTTYTGRHPDSGYYTVATGNTKVKEINGCNIGQDLKWGIASVTVTHRTYHYYCSDNTTRLQLAFPRIDLCDGNQPSIKEMLSNGESLWKDLSGNNNDHIIIANPNTSAGQFNITPANNFLRAAALNSVSPYCTINIWYKTSDNIELWARGNYANNFYLSASEGVGEYYHENGGAPINYIDTVLRTRPEIFRNNTWHMWEAKNVDFSTWGSFEWFGYPGVWGMTGDISVIMVYNKILTDAESKQNFNAIRGRYGI